MFSKFPVQDKPNPFTTSKIESRFYYRIVNLTRVGWAMIELPEATTNARQVCETLTGKKITG